jgi:cellulose synthase/poly-beta-1,6-N-acetylglucosamine synthase-like glycosyltransferase
MRVFFPSNRRITSCHNSYKIVALVLHLVLLADNLSRQNCYLNFAVKRGALSAVPVTVGICAYNEDKNIGQLLEDLSQQELPEEHEVLIVCSGCTDKTVKIAQEHAKQDRRIRVLVEEERKGKASAVNRIIENAKGTIILFVSADTLPHKKMLRQFNLTTQYLG